ncbi:hypothetical protein QTJ16_000296 [Diplocarpon rosae]|uniref:Uncharacterized protein n=1 Tax=Diplocarpon rosae TaxID=946125 RepID=A0AAD9WHA7_9HELO|nr:hypothetical protein QTJ16_000296 [Diplocarpon rosae]
MHSSSQQISPETACYENSRISYDIRQKFYCDIVLIPNEFSLIQPQLYHLTIPFLLPLLPNASHSSQVKN